MAKSAGQSPQPQPPRQTPPPDSSPSPPPPGNGAGHSFPFTPGASLSVREMSEIFNTALIGRQNFLRSLSDPRRDIYAECGYPSDPVDITLYHELYDREAVATRVVQVMPRESWQVTPVVYEDEDGQVTTEFERAFAEMVRNLSGPDNHHIDEEGSRLWGVAREADIVSGIGHYGVIVLGLDDTADMEQPARPDPERRIVWMLALPENMATVQEIDGDITSPRFGQPVYYSVTYQDPRSTTASPLYGPSSMISTRVHWSRVVHVSEGGVFGTPRMRPVLNRLLDLRKLYGGSAEMYWRGAFPGISFETDPSLGGYPTFDVNAMRDSVEAYMNGLQRYFALNGFTAKSLAPQVVDPTPQINVQIEAICIEIGVPVRIFKGSERGELASTQDDAAWNDRLKERQNNFTTPRVIVPLINRMINLGVLPAPKKGYHVWWPDLTSQTDEQKSTVALKLMQSLAQYVSSGGDTVVAPYDFLTYVWKVPEKTAVGIIDRAATRIEEVGAGSLAPPADAPPNKVSQMPNGSPDPSKPAPPPVPAKSA